MMLAIVLYTTVLALFLFTGSAGSTEYSVIGAGHVSCGTWIDDRRIPMTSLSEAQWVLGFLSGVGYQGAQNGVDPLRAVAEDDVAAWLDSYCQTHKSNDLADAAAAFVHEHHSH